MLTFINGHYQASYQRPLAVTGKNRVKRNKIWFTDTGGPGRCRGTGKYKFKLTMGKLKFTKISDTKSCAGRAAVLSHTFTKVS